MTPKQIELVQSSFADVAKNADGFAAVFYEKLFSTAPAVRPLFRRDMAGLRAKLIVALAAVVHGLKRPGAIVPVAHELGRRHVDFGAEENHYPIVGAVLIETLRDALGEAFTAETEEAWSEAYHWLSNVMIEGARAGQQTRAA